MDRGSVGRRACRSGRRTGLGPTKPVKIVAPLAAGGNVDVTARIVAENLQPLLGSATIPYDWQKDFARDPEGGDAA